MGTKNNPGEFDCYAAAMPDEPIFVLLARDESAPAIVEEWARMRAHEVLAGLRPRGDIDKCLEAYASAQKMRKWREKNAPYIIVSARRDDGVPLYLSGGEWIESRANAEVFLGRQTAEARRASWPRGLYSRIELAR